MDLYLEEVLKHSYYNTDIFETIEEGSRIDTIFLDFSKAFDKVNFQKLFQNLKESVCVWNELYGME